MEISAISNSNTYPENIDLRELKEILINSFC